MKESYESIAKRYLDFTKHYGYSFSYEWKTPYRSISLINSDMKILFVELPQFYEKYLYIHRQDEINEIDISMFNTESIKTNEDYWDQISIALKTHLESNTDLMSLSKL